jgi:hypothetical protein
MDKKSQIVADATEAESLLAVYHLLGWPKEAGGAGITPNFGKWENVKSIFPIHNEPTNKSLLKHLSKKFFLTKEDLDQLHGLFGSKVTNATALPPGQPKPTLTPNRSLSTSLTCRLTSCSCPFRP